MTDHTEHPAGAHILETLESIAVTVLRPGALVETLPARLVRILRERGHDVEEEPFPGAFPWGDDE